MSREESDAKLLMFVLAAYAAAGPSATQLLLPALPALQTGFAVDVGTAQLALSLSLLAMAVMQIGCGAWSDRAGRRPVAIWGLVIYITGSLVCALAGDIWMLIAGRIVQGAGGAFGMVLSRAIVRDIYGPTKAASMISILTMAIVVAPMVAPVIGGVLTDHVDWRGVFWFAAGFGGLILMLVWMRLSETLQPAESAEASDERPGFKALLRRRSFVGYALQCGFSMGIFFAFIASAPYVIVNIMGHSATTYGLGFVMVSIGYVIGNFLSAKLSERLGGNRMMLVGTIGAIAALGAMGICYVAGFWSLWAIFIPGSLTALSVGLSLPSAQTAAMNVEPAAAGLASGITGFLQLAFGAMASQAVGMLIDVTPAPMIIGVLLLAVLAFASVLLGWDPKAVGKPRSRKNGKSRKLTKHTTEVALLDADARRKLSNELFPVMEEIMTGYTSDSFYSTFFDPPDNTVCTVQSFRNRDGEAVGFAIARRVTLKVDGRSMTVFRATAAIKRAYRGGGSTLMLGFHLATKWKIKHPFDEVHYYGAMLQPASYYLMTKFAKEIWPCHDAKTPNDRMKLLEDIADGLKLTPVVPPALYARASQRKVIESPEERGYWLASERPEVRFYLEHNPRYFDGSYLISVVPLTWTNFLRSLMSFASEKIALQAGAMGGRIRYRLFGQRRVRVSELLRLIALNEVLGSLGRAAIEKIALGASLQAAKSGQTFIRQGAAANAAYIVTHGRGQVRVSDGDEDYVIAEIERGDVIGEMGVILEQPRMASIKAASAMQVLRIDKETLLAALDEEPEVGRGIRSLIEQRARENHAFLSGS